MQKPADLSIKRNDLIYSTDNKHALAAYSVHCQMCVGSDTVVTGTVPALPVSATESPRLGIAILPAEQLPGHMTFLSADSTSPLNKYMLNSGELVLRT